MKEMEWIYGETYYEYPEKSTKRECQIVKTACSLIEKKLNMPVSCECQRIKTYIKEEYKDLFPELRNKKSDDGWIHWETDVQAKFKVQTPWGKLVGLPLFSLDFLKYVDNIEKVIALFMIDCIQDKIKEKKKDDKKKATKRCNE